MPPRKSTASTGGDTEDTPPTGGANSGSASTSAVATQFPSQTTQQQLKAQAEGGANVEDYLLPRALTQRLAKSVLPPNTTIQKDALLAIQKAATVFVSYLSSHANEATLKRTVAPSDVLTALSELEFDAFKPRLERELEVHTEAQADKKRANKEKKEAAAGGASASETAGAVADTTTTPASAASTVESGAKGSLNGGGKVVANGHGGDGPSIERETKRRRKDGEVDEGDEEEEDEEDDEEEEEVDEEETQMEEEEDDVEEDEEEEEEEEEEEDEEDADTQNADPDLVEDLDRDSRRHNDPDAAPGDESEEGSEDDYDDEGPGAQLRQSMGLG